MLSTSSRNSAIAKAVAHTLPPLPRAQKLLQQYLGVAIAPSSSPKHRIEIVCAGSDKQLYVLFVDPNETKTLRQLLGPLDVMKDHDLAHCVEIGDTAIPYWCFCCDFCTLHDGQYTAIDLNDPASECTLDQLIVVRRVATSDLELWKRGIQCEWTEFHMLELRFRDNIEYNLANIRKWTSDDPYSSLFIPSSMSECRPVVIACLRCYGYTLHRASPDLRDDAKVVMTAVTAHGGALEYASRRLQEDYEIVRTAIASCGQALEHASSKCQAEFDMVMAAVQQNGFAIRYASRRLRANRQIAMAAVSQNGYAIWHVDPELRRDSGVVMVAVANASHAFAFASPELRADREVVLMAVRQNGFTLEYVDPELQKDRDVVMAAVATNGRALKYASSELQADREVALMAVRQHECAILHVDVCIRAAIRRDAASCDARVDSTDTQ